MMEASRWQWSRTRAWCLAIAVGSLSTGPAAALSPPPPPTPEQHPVTDLFLAGGALNICSSLASKYCAEDFELPPGRRPASYRLDAAGMALATAPALWTGAAEGRLESVRALLQAGRKIAGTGDLDDDQIRDVFAAACRRSVASAACAPSPLWERLGDDERGAILSALEQPQTDADGSRMREHVSLTEGRDSAGAEILRAFVASAKKRANGVPKVAFVTASSFDSMDAVDYYLAALRQAGADPRWWPVDQALAAVVFGEGDCQQLDAERQQTLKIAGRERVYSDHAASQLAWCQRPDAAQFPDDLDGIFFAGGDQWRLRLALVDADGAPNAWMRGIRKAFASGRIAVAGTSAGSAVQSALAMVGNGTSEFALSNRGHMRPPPQPGCARSGRCGDVSEDSLTWWSAGGIGLAPFVVDTHFSERAREWRLLTLLAQSGDRAGLGVDETSALHLQAQADGSLAIVALGRSGGWLFSVEEASCGKVEGLANYLAPGHRLHWRDGMAVLPTDSAAVAHTGAERRLDAQAGLVSTALRTSLQSLVPMDAGPLVFADDTLSLRLARGAQTVAFEGVRELRSVLAVQFDLRWPQAGCSARQ